MNIRYTDMHMQKKVQWEKAIFWVEAGFETYTKYLLLFLVDLTLLMKYQLSAKLAPLRIYKLNSKWPLP